MLMDRPASLAPLAPTGSALGVAVAAAGCLGVGSLYGWSALTPALVSRFGIDHSATGQTFSWAIVAFTAGALLAPRLRGGHRTLAVALGGAALCLLGASQAQGFAAFLAFYALGFGAMAGAAYITAVEIASRGPRPGLGVPLVVAAFGAGGAVFGGLLGALLAGGAGLGALAWVGSAVAAAALACMALREGGGGGATVAVADLPRPRTLFRHWLIFAVGSLGGLVALGLAQPISADRGASPWIAALGVVAVAGGNVLGRLGASLLGVRLSPTAVLMLAQVVGGLALLGLLWPGGPGTATALLAAVALGYGLTAAGMPLMVRAAAGPAAFSRAYGVVFTGWGAAGLVGPWVAGVLRDATGGWQSGLALAAGGSLVAVLMLMWERWSRS